MASRPTYSPAGRAPKGASSVQVANTANFKVGQLVVVDEITDNSYVYWGIDSAVARTSGVTMIVDPSTGIDIETGASDSAYPAASRPRSRRPNGR